MLSPFPACLLQHRGLTMPGRSFLALIGKKQRVVDDDNVMR